MNSEIKVTYIDHMGSDLSVVNAARVSFDKTSLYEDAYLSTTGKVTKVLSDKDTKLIRYLASHNHWTPFAHTAISFRVKAPIFVARQLAKHQVGLVWNEVSRRYVDTKPEFFAPKEWRGKPTDGAKQGSSGVVPIEPFGVFCEIPLEYEDIVRVCLDWYGDALANGIAPEMARMVLPQSMMTEWIWTGSLVAFNRVCDLRLDTHTQLETREVALKIADFCSELFPVSWEALRNAKNS